MSYHDINQNLSNLEKWEQLTINTEILQFFNGLFENVGIHILDTDEKFTCSQKENSITFNDGIDQIEVDFTVQIYSYQVDRLAAQVKTGEIDKVEKYRVVSALYEPVAVAGLNSPSVHKFMNSRLFGWLINRKNITHITLKSPDHALEPDKRFTLLFIDRQWLLVPEFYGEPKRKFEVSVPDALELHKRIIQGMKLDTWRGWFKISKWYKNWRKKVSVPL